MSVNSGPSVGTNEFQQNRQETHTRHQVISSTRSLNPGPASQFRRGPSQGCGSFRDAASSEQSNCALDRSCYGCADVPAHPSWYARERGTGNSETGRIGFLPAS
eukprot:1106145-Rhodomonas_salina.1